MYKNIKILENKDEYIELSEDVAEILLCKQFVKPFNTEFTVFTFNNFNSNWFKNDERKSIFKCAKAYWDKFGNLPSESVFLKIFENKKFCQNTENILDEFNKIYHFNDSEMDEKFVKNVITTYVKHKAIYFTILDSVDRIENDGEIGKITETFEKIVRIDLDDDLGIEYFKDFEKHAQKLSETHDRVPFGFSELDKFTYGGLPAKDTCLFLVMAPPGKGKSQFMMNVACNWIKQNKKVLVISLEMSEDMYARRFDALFAKLNPNCLKDNIPLLRSRVYGIKAGVPNGELRIKEFATGTLTTSLLKQYINKLKTSTGFSPDIIFVDYLNIMRPNSYGANTTLYEKCGKISEELRALSSEMKIPIFSATQCNRGTNGYAGDDVDINNVSESSGIAATIDGLIAFFQLEGEREIGKINCKILKNRLGGNVGTIFPLSVDYETLIMEDWAENTRINDEVLGDVTDASDKMFQNKKQNKIIEENDGFEDL